jgi:hypothetical protein
LMGNHKSRALGALGLGAALFECWEGFKIETRQKAAMEPLRHGGSGTVTRVGGLLSGPLPTALRVLGLLSGNPRSLRKAAAVSAIAGSLLTRIAWIYAGHVSAKDWRLPLNAK